MIRVITTLFIIGFFSITQLDLAAQGCDCPGDFNNDGVVTYSDELLALMNLLENQALDCYDLNNDDVINLYDFMDFTSHLGQSCNITELEQSPSSFTGLHVIEWTEYPDGVFGTVDGLEDQMKIYRVYAHFSNANEYLLGTYGESQSPLEIHHTAPLFSMSGEYLSFADQTNFDFSNLLPQINFRSYFAFGYNEYEMTSSMNPIHLTSNSNDVSVFEDFLSSESGSISGVNGIYWGKSSTFPEAVLAEESNYKLIAQFTTAGDVYGTINLASRYQGEFEAEMNHYHEGLNFSTQNLDIAGCTYPNDPNYSPEATINLGCVFDFGDLNGDYTINNGDLLYLLSSFGCFVDCGAADLNNDGVVNSGDLVQILSLM